MGLAESLVLIVDDLGRVVAANRLAQRLGSGDAPIKGAELQDLLVDGDAAQVLESAATLKGALLTPTRIARYALRKGGTLLADTLACPTEYFGQAATLLLIEPHAVDGDNAAAMRRRTEQLERELADAKSDLEQSRKLAESFSYLVAHDLRSPLNVVEGYTAELAEGGGGPLPARAQEFVGHAQEAAARMGRLIDGMLALARAARVPLHPKEVDLAQVARAVVAELRAAQASRHVDAEIASSLPVHGDPDLLRVLMRELVGNAWKFTARREHAWIRVALGEPLEDGGVRIVVSDNGAGFDMQHAPRLFTAFHRLHSSREFPGAGLGLAVARQVVQRHGGAIRVPFAGAEGASFEVTLPEAPA